MIQSTAWFRPSNRGISIFPSKRIIDCQPSERNTSAPAETTVAVKITGMLGEEVLETRRVWGRKAAASGRRDADSPEGIVDRDQPNQVYST